MSQVISLVILPSKFCSGTLEASLSKSLWRSSLGRNSHLSPTGLKSKETMLRRTNFLLTHFQLLDFEEHSGNCFPDLLDWRQRASPGWKEWRATQGISLSSSPVIFVLAFLLITGDNYPALSMIDCDQGERCEAWEILPWREVCASPTVIWGKMFKKWSM